MRLIRTLVGIWILLLSLGAIATVGNAWASLGGTADSVETDRQALNGKSRITSHELYSIHEVTAGARNIREFVRKDGTVFAVSWQGPVPPDLSLVLGKYYEEYQFARKSSAGIQRRGARVTRSAHAVVEESGHMRDIRGKAYLPRLVPPGLNVAEVH